MAAYKQLVAPRKGTQDGVGWCLRFAQSFFGAPVAHPSAWAAWNAATYKHGVNDPLPAGAAVLLWFSHWGTYGGVYANWGHVAAYVPGDAIYTSPASGWGQGRYGTIAEIERVFGAKYVGWSEAINGLRVAEPAPTPPTPGQEEDEDMARFIGCYIGGANGDAPEKNSCVIYEPTSGFYTTWAGVTQAYTNEMARTYGTASFNRITKKHWDQTILPQLLIQQAKRK